MARRADILVESIVTGQWSGAGTNYIVQTPAGVLYMVNADSLSDVSFRKSSDGGLTWSAATAVFAGTVTNLSVWYDRWSNIAAGLIHIAYTESGGSDTLYRTINTESSDALSTQTTIFAGSSRLAGGHLSITRAVGGNVYCKTIIDAGTEGGFYRLLNANVPNGAWDAARTIDETAATLDQMLLLPDYDAADTQDIMAIFQDASVTETSRKLYDDSANSWSETSINASVAELSTATAFPNFDVAMDITNTNHILVVWNATDAANQDLLCYTVDSGAITAKTDVVTNATDDCGLCAVSLDTQTGYWHVFYGGKSDGSETWNTALNIYMKTSKDSGSTWGPETLVNTGGTAFTLRNLITCPRLISGPPVVAWVRDAQVDDLIISVDRTEPHAAYQLGV
jgi:hypothetical protein